MPCAFASALKMLVKHQSSQQVFHNLGASPQGDALGFHVLKHIIPALVLCHYISPVNTIEDRIVLLNIGRQYCGLENEGS